MTSLAKLHDEALEHEHNLMSDVEMLTEVRLKMYKNQDKDTLKEIFPVLNTIQEDVDAYRDWLEEQNNDTVKLGVDKEVVQRLRECFTGSFVNDNGEFIAYQRANEYFILRDCETELDVKCKVLEWFSRGAFKTQRFDTDRENDEFHAFMLSGINQFLGTEFTEDDMEVIYTYLGNACNHEKTIAFIETGYIMTVLTEYGK